jgi:hypothetical protein
MQDFSYSRLVPYRPDADRLALRPPGRRGSSCGLINSRCRDRAAPGLANRRRSENACSVLQERREAIILLWRRPRNIWCASTAPLGSPSGMPLIRTVPLPPRSTRAQQSALCGRVPSRRRLRLSAMTPSRQGSASILSRPAAKRDSARLHVLTCFCLLHARSAAPRWAVACLSFEARTPVSFAPPPRCCWIAGSCRRSSGGAIKRGLKWKRRVTITLPRPKAKQRKSGNAYHRVIRPIRQLFVQFRCSGFFFKVERTSPAQPLSEL